MMSESDDTDVLLLIPPDLFIVQSSSDSESDHCNKKSGVISELVEHMQSLETRISAIESKDNSLDTTVFNTSIDSQNQGNVFLKYRQTLPRTKLSVSQTSSLQNSPIKSNRSLSVPTTPSGYIPSNNTNLSKNDMRLGYHNLTSGNSNMINTNLNARNKHEFLTYSDSLVSPSASQSKRILHVDAVPYKKESCSSLSIDHSANISNLHTKNHDQLYSTVSTSNLPSTTVEKSYGSRNISEMDLCEVERLLKDMEDTELKLFKRCGTTTLPQNYQANNNYKVQPQARILSNNSSHRKLDFEEYDKEAEIFSKNRCSNTLLPSNDSFHLNESDKIIKEFKTWEPGTPIPKISSSIKTDTNSNNNLNESEMLHSNILRPRESFIEVPCVTDAIPASNPLEYPKKYQIDPSKSSVNGVSLNSNNEVHESSCHNVGGNVSTNTESFLRKDQQVLSLSDFWTTNSNKPREEQLKIKLEEERFRRQHCESLIHELQKKLLEQQEKVAVAMRVDNEKNLLISQFKEYWIKLKTQVQLLESENEALQTVSKNMTEKHQSESLEFQAQSKRYEAEVSKALDLAAGYKEKSDSLIKEKVELLKSHADELESYKSLVQEAENRYDQLKCEYNKLLDKNEQTEGALKNIQQELNKERLKGGEVRNEMGVIHKALDTCEAELTVLRQEKEGLQLKLKEELNRNTLLEEKNISLLSMIDEVKKAEKIAKNETKVLVEQQDKIKTELQELYQKQVDAVVEGKLQEFQTQLDTAESEFLTELENRQRITAECAARKIKDMNDKHQLEIKLLEEKHKEEKRLQEIQLAQILQKTAMLESQLNSQHVAKSHLAEQLHSVMQQQWQQALQIISSTVPGGGIKNHLPPFQRINTSDAANHPIKNVSYPSWNEKLQDPMKCSLEQLERRQIINPAKQDDQNESALTLTSADEIPLMSHKEPKEDLRKYIKMISEMQEQNQNFSAYKHGISSPSPTYREVPRKHYIKKEVSLLSEDSVMQLVSESDAHDTVEYIPVSQKNSIKSEKQKMKRPWK